MEKITEHLTEKNVFPPFILFSNLVRGLVALGAIRHSSVLLLFLVIFRPNSGRKKRKLPDQTNQTTTPINHPIIIIQSINQSNQQPRQSTNQSINLTNQSFSQSINQPIKSTNNGQPVSPHLSINQSNQPQKKKLINHSINQPMNQSTSQHVNQPTNSGPRRHTGLLGGRSFWMWKRRPRSEKRSTPTRG